MWFVFGFFSLAGFAVYAMQKRVAARWTGLRASVRGQRYEYDVLRNRTDRGDKARAIGLRIGVAASPGYDFSLKPEQWRDWLSKKIGFSVEHQTGDAEFDAAVYILSNDARIHSILSQSKVLRADILRVFRVVASRSAALKEVRCAGGRLWVHYKLKDGLNAAKLPVLAEKIVPALERLAADLARATVAGAPKLYDRFVLRASIILAISTGLTMNGAAHLMRLVYMPVPFTVDNSTLVLWALYCAATVLAALVVAVVWFLGRSARAHVVLLEVLLVGSLGAVLTSFMELRDLNMEWDQHAPTRYEVTTVDQRISRGRRHTSYYITVRGWPAASETTEIQVPSWVYHRTARGGTVDLLQKPGFLKVPWVAAVVPR